MDSRGGDFSNPPRRISLVVPLQDEEATIESLLHSLSKQTLPADEVVLVDAGSRDETFRRVAAVAADLPIRIIAAGRVYPGAARNAGVQASKHEWIAFTDGGVTLDVSWLAELAERATGDVDVVYGNYEPLCNSYFRQCAAIAYVSARNAFGTRGPSLASCMMRREAFTRVGGFPPFRAAEDLILIDRLQQAGARTAFAPKASIEWQIAGTVAATFRRFESYSFHNLVAGWGRHWHAGTARLYAGLSVVIVAASFFGAAAWTVPILVAFFVARAAKSAYRKRRSFDFQTRAPQRILGAAGILVLIDLATFIGFARWIIARGLR